MATQLSEPLCRGESTHDCILNVRDHRTMYGMGNRSDRIEARIEPARVERIRFASQLVEESMSSFVVQAAIERAERIIAERTFTTVDDEYFDKLIASLDEPAKPIPALQRAVRKNAQSRAFVQR